MLLLLVPFVVLRKGQLALKWVEPCLRGSDILILKGCFTPSGQGVG